MKEHQIITTKDGSHTIYVPELGEHYHSSFGAIQEAQHIFIENGFKRIKKPVVSILEVGFGTGLNCLLSFLEAEKTGQRIIYHAVEKYPLEDDEIAKINYGSILNAGYLFSKIHWVDWMKNMTVNGNTLFKIPYDVLKTLFPQNYDIVYFDAFSPNVQPELWTEKLFSKIFQHLRKDGFLVTYSSKGTVKEALRAAGFFVQRLDGPEGKRHILSAGKEFKGNPPKFIGDEKPKQAPKQTPNG